MKGFRGIRKGFTLLELLIVIAILALLISLSLPVIGTALKRGKKVKAQAETRSIHSAIQAYFNEYSKLPVADGAQGGSDDLDGWHEGDDSKDVIQALLGIDNSASVRNPREIRFLEMQLSGTDGTFEDPWGTQNSIKMDVDYSGRVAYPGSGTENVGSIAVVISYGEDQTRGSSALGDDIVSYQQ